MTCSREKFSIFFPVIRFRRSWYRWKALDFLIPDKYYLPCGRSSRSVKILAPKSSSFRSNRPHSFAYSDSARVWCSACGDILTPGTQPRLTSLRTRPCAQNSQRYTPKPEISAFSAHPVDIICTHAGHRKSENLGFRRVALQVLRVRGSD